MRYRFTKFGADSLRGFLLEHGHNRGTNLKSFLGKRRRKTALGIHKSVSSVAVI